MKKPVIYILEPSKVGVQHLSFLESYLQTIINTKKVSDIFDINFVASKKTIDKLDKSKLMIVNLSTILVIDPLKRRLVLKTIVEAFQVLKLMLKKKRDDKLLITCLLPTSLIFIEQINRILKKRGIYVVLHGEIESLFDSTKQSIFRIGWWSRFWWKLRSADSKIKLVVIDDFIKDRIDKICINKNDIAVIHQPIIPLEKSIPSDPIPKVCFVGYRTKNKGYREFIALAEKHPKLEFVAIGGEVEENIRTGKKNILRTHDDYLDAISSCSLALFLYTDGYRATLSGAALDAIKLGVTILALNRPFFVSISDHLGDKIVAIREDFLQVSEYLDNLQYLQSHKLESSSLILQSKYSVKAIAKKMDEIFLGDQ
tara:strand:- start:1289 stop:2398 length:1110 start_codon:yes stop_codon:yes gene_type:complete